MNGTNLGVASDDIGIGLSVAGAVADLHHLVARFVK